MVLVAGNFPAASALMTIEGRLGMSSRVLSGEALTLGSGEEIMIRGNKGQWSKLLLDEQRIERKRRR